MKSAISTFAHAIVVPVVLACLPAFACTSFQDPTTVVDLRVLAVNTEPSEIILDVDLTDPTMPVVNPASNPPVVVTPLIVDPAGRPITYTMLACPNDPFASAPPGPGMGGGAFPSGGARTTVGSALCDPQSPNTWTLSTTPIQTPLGDGVQIQPSADQLKAAFTADIFPDQYGNLHGGFDLGEPFVLQLQVDAGGERLDVLKRVLYWARPIDAAQTPNRTPVMGGLLTFPDRDPDTADPLGTVSMLEDGVPFQVPAGSKPWIQPAPAEAESYETTILDPTTHLAVPLTVARETLRYAFYATAGSFAPARTSSELPPGFVGTVHLESQYSAPAAVPADPMVTIWVVVRDDRGGESWLVRTLGDRPARDVAALNSQLERQVQVREQVGAGDGARGARRVERPRGGEDEGLAVEADPQEEQRGQARLHRAADPPDRATPVERPRHPAGHGAPRFLEDPGSRPQDEPHVARAEPTPEPHDPAGDRRPFAEARVVEVALEHQQPRPQTVAEAGLSRSTGVSPVVDSPLPLGEGRRDVGAGGARQA